MCALVKPLPFLAHSWPLNWDPEFGYWHTPPNWNYFNTVGFEVIFVHSDWLLSRPRCLLRMSESDQQLWHDKHSSSQAFQLLMQSGFHHNAKIGCQEIQGYQPVHSCFPGLPTSLQPMMESVPTSLIRKIYVSWRKISAANIQRIDASSFWDCFTETILLFETTTGTLSKSRVTNIIVVGVISIWIEHAGSCTSPHPARAQRRASATIQCKGVVLKDAEFWVHTQAPS